MNLTVLGKADDKTIDQMMTCLAAAEGSVGALLPDNHLGYNQPVGGVACHPEHISVSGVGYDIGCGNKAVRTGLRFEDLASGGGRDPVQSSSLKARTKPRSPDGGAWNAVEGPDSVRLKNEASLHAYSAAGKTVSGIMDEVAERVSFGIGQSDKQKVEHPVLDAIREFDFPPVRNLYEKAANQLGTVGAGNHYVDLFKDQEGYVWVGVHFGSRGFGHTIAKGFMHLATGGEFDQKGDPSGEMMSPPILLHQDSDLGQSYIAAMGLAGRYAYAGRDAVVDRVLEILGAESTYEVHNHHNFAWREEHFGQEYWVARKGATPAFPGQQGFVGATMGEDSVILEGTAGTESVYSSTVHGAGRAMSRTQAAGRRKRRWTCSNRDCDWVQPKGTHKPDACPACGNARIRKADVQISEGEIDWPSERASISSKNIELRGGAADEAPPAYKRLTEVLADCGDTVNVLDVLTPIGVAMAGAGTVDPYKD